MESTGVPGEVHISEHTYRLLAGSPHEAWFEHRGQVEVKVRRPGRDVQGAGGAGLVRSRDGPSAPAFPAALGTPH